MLGPSPTSEANSVVGTDASRSRGDDASPWKCDSTIDVPIHRRILVAMAPHHYVKESERS